MKLYNSLSKKIEGFVPEGDVATIYSCGPTVYDHAHIGNLLAYVSADTLRRVLLTDGVTAKHVMNFTDVDDKTIKRSSEEFKADDPKTALSKLTRKYEDVFLKDIDDIGIDSSAFTFIRATESIEEMQELIKELHKAGIAYIADDGVYLSLKKYKESGKKYGQLVDIDESNTSEERISNDEYDKESVHDFALWKTKKDGEPAWNFELDGKDLSGRPGWHIECSAMSKLGLGTPFDIHTGGIDLAFPHHENEIAQSTGASDDPVYARFFVHNEHLLVDGKKMSKSLQNFYTLEDIKEKGFEPIVFRLLVLQSHYRSRTNFTWESLEAASHRLEHLKAFADLQWQGTEKDDSVDVAAFSDEFNDALQNDLDTPKALEALAKLVNSFDNKLPSQNEAKAIGEFIGTVDATLGLGISGGKDISDEQKELIKKREEARESKDWNTSDSIRDDLNKQGITVNDTDDGSIWSRT